MIRRKIRVCKRFRIKKMVIDFCLGSEKPVFTDDGIYRLYSMRFCPYAARSHLVLDAKKIPYHTVNIHLLDKPEWLFDANPIGKVPALQLVDKPNAPFIYESLLIAEYLDDVHPENKLYPSDPLAKVQEKLWIERFGTIASKFHAKIVDGPAQWDEIQKGLDEFEHELSLRGTSYFGGDKANILDYAIWPWFPRTEVLDVLFGKGCTFSEQRFPHLVRLNHYEVRKCAHLTIAYPTFIPRHRPNG